MHPLDEDFVLLDVGLLVGKPDGVRSINSTYRQSAMVLHTGAGQ